MAKSRYELYERLLIENGRIVQMLKAIEEASEFQQALAKMIGDNGKMDSVIEETADLMIMLEQIIYGFDIFKEVEDMKEAKIDRQWRRLDGKQR